MSTVQDLAYDGKVLDAPATYPIPSDADAKSSAAHLERDLDSKAEDDAEHQTKRLENKGPVGYEPLDDNERALDKRINLKLDFIVSVWPVLTSYLKRSLFLQKAAHHFDQLCFGWLGQEQSWSAPICLTVSLCSFANPARQCIDGRLYRRYWFRP